MKQRTILLSSELIPFTMETTHADLPVIDLTAVQQLLSREWRGSNLFQRLLERFQHEAPGLIDQFQKAIADESSQEAYEAMHALKASCSIIGARRLWSDVESLSHTTAAGNLPSAAAPTQLREELCLFFQEAATLSKVS